MAIRGSKIASCKSKEWGAGFQWPKTWESQTHRDLPLPLLMVLSIQEGRKQWANRTYDHFVTLEFIAVFLLWFLKCFQGNVQAMLLSCSVFLNSRWNNLSSLFFTVFLQSLLLTPHFFLHDFPLLPPLSSALKAQQEQLPQDLCEFLTRKAIRQFYRQNKVVVCSILPHLSRGAGSGFNTQNRNCSRLLCSLPSASCTFSLAKKGFKSKKETSVFLLFLHWRSQFYNHPYCQSGTKEEN